MSYFKSTFPRGSLPRIRCSLTIGAVALAAVVVVVVVAGFLASGARDRISPQSRSAPAQRVAPRQTSLQVTLPPGASTVAVPHGFLGISTEYWTIPVWASHVTLLDHVLAMLAVDGPVRLRIGGDSADHAFWAPSRELPEWVFELTPSWLTQVSRIVQQSHVKLILDLNLVTATPARAAEWARTAVAKLPRGSITAFEIGNEPDIYNQSAWQHVTWGVGAPPLPKRITAASYAHTFASYARALARVAPGVPLLAPALAEPQKNSGWLTKLLNAPHPGLTGVTAHRYPYSTCARRGSATFPTIARVLSENATAGMARTALKVEHISDRARLPLWLTEINSVTCGGTRGVSDTFATALWAPDALFELVRAGVESASVHVRADAINMAFSLTRKGLVAYPLFYGMVLFARMLGPGAQLTSAASRRTGGAPSQGLGGPPQRRRDAHPAARQGQSLGARTPRTSLHGHRHRPAADRAEGDVDGAGDTRQPAPDPRRHLGGNATHRDGRPTTSGYADRAPALQRGPRHRSPAARLVTLIQGSHLADAAAGWRQPYRRSTRRR